jgi:RHH-type proline utilization regulon transcriptional repressor/proline dehydrogenase/delta 1-pyrroline-5-carboxylate dehydrogenase
VFAEVPTDAKLIRTDVDGPIVAIVKAGSMKEAIGIANDLGRHAIGAVFSRTPSHIEMAQETMQADVLLINEATIGDAVIEPLDAHDLEGWVEAL